jgi:hypothetical protein
MARWPTISSALVIIGNNRFEHNSEKSIILVRILFRIFVILILGRLFIYILNQLKLNMQILIKVYFKSYNFWIDLLFKKNMFDAFGLKDGPNISIIS